MLEYLDYNYEDINEELKKIKNITSARIILEPNNKKCLFILGILFTYGIKIEILNEKELNLTEKGKSFSMMAYVWNKLSDDKFPLSDYSDCMTDFDQKIENIKRLGVKVNKINNNPISNKIFLICPVRNASENQRKWMEKYTKSKYEDGYIIHAPHLHTRQVDLFGGYSICLQNASAIATSSEVDIYYDKSSTGSIFDLGVAYALEKPIKILNEIEFDNNDFFDSLISNWPYNSYRIKRLKYDDKKE